MYTPFVGKYLSTFIVSIVLQVHSDTYTCSRDMWEACHYARSHTRWKGFCIMCLVWYILCWKPFHTCCNKVAIIYHRSWALQQLLHSGWDSRQIQHLASLCVVYTSWPDLCVINHVVCALDAVHYLVLWSSGSRYPVLLLPCGYLGRLCLRPPPVPTHTLKVARVAYSMFQLMHMSCDGVKSS